MRSSFDLVHQRLVLPFCGASNTPMQTCVNALVGLTRPGGWVQLVEADHTTKDADGPEIRKVSALVRTMLGLMSTDLAYSHTMYSMLVEAGC